MTGVSVEAVLNVVESHALALGVFDKVNTHEPKVASNQGLWCAIWVQQISPASGGLNSTSVRLGFTVRIGTNMVSEPQDAIDINAVKALDLLMAAYSSDFDAGGLARMIDLKGAEGAPLSAVAGYIQMGQSVFRVFDITLPIVINDCWEQVP